MFAVGPVLVSDALLDAPFACNLGVCHGACCVVGDRGAPLEPEELDILEDALPVVENRLRPEAREVIAKEGVWEEHTDGTYSTTMVDGKECVFVQYEGPVATCALQRAYNEGRLDVEKPISCHLFPIRVERFGEGDDTVEVLNVERIPLCDSAVPHGRRTGTQLAEFLRKPLTRAYGEEWFQQFKATLAERREVLEIEVDETPQTPKHVA